MSACCSYSLDVIILCDPSTQSITHHMHTKALYIKRQQVKIAPYCITWLPYGAIYIYIYIFVKNTVQLKLFHLYFSLILLYTSR